MQSPLKDQFPYKDLDETTAAKTGAYVSNNDKRLIMTVLPDSGIYTLIIQTAFKRTADYVRRHKLTYCSADIDRLTDFITLGYDALEAGHSVQRDAAARLAGRTSARNDSPAASGVHSTLPSVSDQRTDNVESSSRRRKNKKDQG